MRRLDRAAWGGRKFGMPWARFTPPYWLTTRVISRMTDSVKPWTRWEIAHDGCGLSGLRRWPGTIATSSPSLSAVAWFSRNRMSSWFT